MPLSFLPPDVPPKLPECSPLPEVFIGLPYSDLGGLYEAAQGLSAPVLISMGSLYRPESKPGAKRYRKAGFQKIGGAAWRLPSSLDSAGFSAMRMGGYRWTVDEYVDFVVTNGGAGEMPFPWLWWSAMDYCCEPEIAPDRPEVEKRIALTVTTYGETLDSLIARRREGVTDIPDPLPILQGRTPADYVACARALAHEIDAHHDCTCPLETTADCPAEWHRQHAGLPALVGLGSVCRRVLHGPEGILTVLRELDAHLPRHVKLHLFGVKGPTLSALGPVAHRVASTDSMAWSEAVRREAREAGVACSMPLKQQAMRDWYSKQVTTRRGPKRAPRD